MCKERAIYNGASHGTPKIKANNLRVAWKAVNIRSLGQDGRRGKGRRHHPPSFYLAEIMSGRAGGAAWTAFDSISGGNRAKNRLSLSQNEQQHQPVRSRSGKSGSTPMGHGPHTSFKMSHVIFDTALLYSVLRVDTHDPCAHCIFKTETRVRNRPETLCKYYLG